jgi:hypothetical protein
MLLLKPRRRIRQPVSGLQQIINALAKGSIAHQVFDPVARRRLQDDPGIMGGFPQLGLKTPPDFVGGMIPRPTQIQGKLRQGIEPFEFRG